MAFLHSLKSGMILLCEVSAEDTGKCLANLSLIAYNYIKEAKVLPIHQGESTYFL